MSAEKRQTPKRWATVVAPSVVAGGADPGICVALSGRTGTKTKERPISPSKKIKVNAGYDFIPPFPGRATSGDECSVVTGGADPGVCVTLSGRTGTKTKERPISPSKKINVNAGNDFIPPFPGRATSEDECSVVAGGADPGVWDFGYTITEGSARGYNALRT